MIVLNFVKYSFPNEIIEWLDYYQTVSCEMMRGLSLRYELVNCAERIVANFIVSHPRPGMQHSTPNCDVTSSPLSPETCSWTHFSSSTCEIRTILPMLLFYVLFDHNLNLIPRRPNQKIYFPIIFLIFWTIHEQFMVNWHS